jgi:NAD(P)H-dependent flavin oxidoreductase YrpB (nitropropane dioxygenase family)
MLGAVGVNLGTRFIASTESPAAIRWKEEITAAASEDTMKADVLNDIRPLPGTAGYGTVLRSLRTAFLDEWSGKRDEVRRERHHLKSRIAEAARAGRQHEFLLTAGQSVGGINEILPVGEIIRRLMDQAEAALSRAAPLRKQIRHQPANLPLETLMPLSDDAMAKEIPEPDSLGG